MKMLETFRICCELTSKTVFLKRYVFIGMSDPDKTYDFRWTDGSIMKWALWNSGEPNHGGGLEPYGGMFSTRSYNDFRTSENFPGLCEKSGKK